MAAYNTQLVVLHARYCVCVCVLLKAVPGRWYQNNHLWIFECISTKASLEQKWYTIVHNHTSISNARTHTHTHNRRERKYETYLRSKSETNVRTSTNITSLLCANEVYFCIYKFFTFLLFFFVSCNAFKAHLYLYLNERFFSYIFIYIWLFYRGFVCFQ